ncbi:MAG: hypothetical protein ACM3SR_04210 [Ignavibacteriales bacterium]
MRKTSLSYYEKEWKKRREEILLNYDHCLWCESIFEPIKKPAIICYLRGTPRGKHAKIDERDIVVICKRCHYLHQFKEAYACPGCEEPKNIVLRPHMRCEVCDPNIEIIAYISMLKKRIGIFRNYKKDLSSRVIADIGKIREVRSKLQILEDQLNTLGSAITDNISSHAGIVYKAQTKCRVCRKGTVVYDWFPHGPKWRKIVPPEIIRPYLDYQSSTETANEQYANICSHCRSVQGGFSLYFEPGGAFYNQECDLCDAMMEHYDWLGIDEMDEEILNIEEYRVIDIGESKRGRDLKDYEKRDEF